MPKRTFYAEMVARQQAAELETSQPKKRMARTKFAAAAAAGRSKEIVVKSSVRTYVAAGRHHCTESKYRTAEEELRVTRPFHNRNKQSKPADSEDAFGASTASRPGMSCSGSVGGMSVRSATSECRMRELRGVGTGILTGEWNETHRPPLNRKRGVDSITASCSASTTTLPESNLSTNNSFADGHRTGPIRMCGYGLTSASGLYQ